MSFVSNELSFSGTISTNYKYFPFIQTDGLSHIRVNVLTNAQVYINVIWSMDGINTLVTNTYTAINTDGNTNSYSIKARYVKITIDNYQFPVTPSLTLQTLLFREPASLAQLENTGTGAQLYKETEQKIRTVKSSDSSITITQLTNEIDLIASGSVYPISLSSVGGTSLVYNSTGPNLSIKGLSNGSFISLVDNTTYLSINNNAPNITTVLTASSFINISGAYPNYTIEGQQQIPTISPSTGISISNVGNSFTIVNTLPNITTVLVASSGISISGTYPNYTIENSRIAQLYASTGISISNSVADWTIVNTAPNITTVLTASSFINISGAYPNYTIEGQQQIPTINPSTGISISNVGNSFTIVNIAPNITTILTASSFINISGAYPNYTIQGQQQIPTISASTGISISNVGNSFTIVNIAPNITTVLTASSGISITGTYPNYTIQNNRIARLFASTGISISNSVADWTIVNTAPNITTVLTAGTNITITGSYPNYTISGSGGGSGVKTITHAFNGSYNSTLGGVYYSYIATFSITDIPTIAMPVNCTLTSATFSPDNGAGHTSNPTNLNGGNLEISLGRVLQDTAFNVAANFTAYPSSPHFLIPYTAINSSTKNWRSFVFSANISVTAGDRVSLRIVNNITNSAARPSFYASFTNLVYEY